MRARLIGVICPEKTPVYFDPQGPGQRGILKITIKIKDLSKFNDSQMIRK
jgi:hypothetical protein